MRIHRKDRAVNRKNVRGGETREGKALLFVNGGKYAHRFAKIFSTIESLLSFAGENPSTKEKRGYGKSIEGRYPGYRPGEKSPSKHAPEVRSRFPEEIEEG